jgi:UrcA family protein
MSIKLSRGIISSSVAGAAFALGLALSGAQAQPYDSGASAKMSNDDMSPYAKSAYGDAPANASDYASDTSATVGGLTVTAPRRVERTRDGAEVVVASAQRVVDISDLDLSSRGGRNELRMRVENAATDACNQLDTTLGLYPVDSDSDCWRHAVDGAMSQAASTTEPQARR